MNIARDNKIKGSLENIQMELLHNLSNDYVWLHEPSIIQSTLLSRRSIGQRAHQTWT